MTASNARSHGLFGTWKLISNRITMEDTGEELDLLAQIREVSLPSPAMDE